MNKSRTLPLDITLCSGEFCPCRQSCRRYVSGQKITERAEKTAQGPELTARDSTPTGADGQLTNWVTGSRYDHGRGRCELFIRNN